MKFSIASVLVLTLVSAIVFWLSPIVFRFTQPITVREFSIGTANVTVKSQSRERNLQVEMYGLCRSHDARLIQRRLSANEHIVQRAFEALAKGPNPSMLLYLENLGPVEAALLRDLHQQGHTDILAIGFKSYLIDGRNGGGLTTSRTKKHAVDVKSPTGLPGIIATNLNEFASVVIKALGLRLSFEQRKELEHTIKRILNAGGSYLALLY